MLSSAAGEWGIHSFYICRKGIKRMENSGPENAHVLDNPIWNALQTGNRGMAQGSTQAAYFNAAIAPFAGMPQLSEEGWWQLQAADRPDGDVFILFSTAAIAVPQPWKVLAQLPLYQMVYAHRQAPQVKQGAAMVSLTAQDVPAMLELTRLTNPGPFRNHTIDFGHYYGVKHEGQLVAITGRRLRPLPYHEVSAVCTHPDFLGRGYAAQLIARQVQLILEEGGIPFLHVKDDNTAAVKLYEKLGFETRTAIVCTVLALKA